MNFKTTTIAIGIVLLILQGCASLELTQSRYGNGIGISFGNGSANHDEKGTQFRERKRQEVQNRNFVVQSYRREMAPLKTNLETLFEQPSPVSFKTSTSNTTGYQEFTEIAILSEARENHPRQQSLYSCWYALFCLQKSYIKG